MTTEQNTDTIKLINDEIETLARHLGSFAGLLGYIAGQSDDLIKMSAFYSLQNTAEAAHEKLQGPCERLAKFETGGSNATPTG